jgi:hypothetical protein
MYASGVRKKSMDTQASLDATKDVSTSPLLDAIALPEEHL